MYGPPVKLRRSLVGMTMRAIGGSGGGSGGGGSLQDEKNRIAATSCGTDLGK